MMKIKFLIFCFLGLASCSKNSGSSSVIGQAIDQTTGKGVPYAGISLISKNSSVVGAGGSQQLQTVTADINGDFSFNFNSENGNTYFVQAQAPYYYNDGNAVTTLVAGKNTNVKIKMVPQGWVRINLINLPPLDTIQEFILYDFNGEVDDNKSIYQNKSYLVYGYGNTLTHFSYRIRRGTTLTSYSDSIFIKALDTISCTINY